MPGRGSGACGDDRKGRSAGVFPGVLVRHQQVGGPFRMITRPRGIGGRTLGALPGALWNPEA